MMHNDLIVALKFAYEPSKLVCHNFLEGESKEYAAFSFEINDLQILFRVAKKTPTKIGQFVTIWKRINNSVIMPYDMSDAIDFFIISVRK